MSPAFERGHVLLQQGRHDLAEREFRQGLSEDPDNAFGHSQYALCLIHRDAKADALREATEAVRLEPNFGFHHYVLSIAQERNGRLKEAEAAAQQALELDPGEADYFGQLASLALQRGRPKDALSYAEEGLACDAENTWCANLRAMALVKLDRKAEAGAALGSALSDDPEDALTHANQGWTCLHQGNYKQALVHYREALRLNPEFEWAREGLKESLKARYPFYRVVLGFSLWLYRQQGWVQIAVIAMLVLGQRLLRGVGGAFPVLGPLMVPLAVALFGFILLSWVAEPLANFLLQFHPLGRLALTRTERIESLLIGGLFVAALAALTARIFGVQDGLLWAIFFGFMIFPVNTLFRLPNPWARLAMGGAIVYMIYLAVPMLTLTIKPLPAVPPEQVMVDMLRRKRPELAKELVTALRDWQLFVNLAVGSSWIPMIFGGHRWLRG